jgi:hypothetical protein
LRFPEAFLRGALLNRSAFGSKNMQQHFFSFESSELQKNKTDASFHCSSVQERLVTYGSEALDTAEHSRKVAAAVSCASGRNSLSSTSRQSKSVQSIPLSRQGVSVLKTKERSDSS